MDDLSRYLQLPFDDEKAVDFLYDMENPFDLDTNIKIPPTLLESIRQDTTMYGPLTIQEPDQIDINLPTWEQLVSIYESDQDDFYYFRIPKLKQSQYNENKYYDVVALFNNLPDDAKSVLDEHNYYKNEENTLKCCFNDIY